MEESKLVSLLVEDVIDAQASQRNADSPTSRRQLVRAIFAAIDGLAFAYREFVRDALRDMDLLDPDEEAALEDYSIFISEKGTVSKQRRYLSTQATIRLASRMASRANPDLEIDFGDGAWEVFRQSKRVRNRITHPKTADDLTIPDDELSQCIMSFYWFMETMLEAMEAATVALKDYSQWSADYVKALKAGDPDAWQAYRAAQALQSADD